MKKLLLAGTALVAFASPAKAELKLDLGGYYYGYVGYVDQDNDTNLRDFDWKRDTEVHFKGETTLDNGLTVGVKVELEGEQNSDVIDENNLYFAGNWGKVILGSEDSASYLLQVVAPAADEFVDGYDPKFNFANAPAGFEADNNYAQGFTGDTDKVSYITPKFNGFQAGVSYTPNVTAGELTAANGLGGMTADNAIDEVEFAYDAGFRYDGEFEGVGVAFGAGYTFGALGTEVAGEDYKEWNVGLSASFDAFTLGVAYNTDNGAVNDGDTDNWVVGASYEYGPYTFGASYFTSEEDSSSDELDRYSIGANYAFGPGMTFRGSVNLHEYESATDGNNDAVSVLVGTAVHF